MSNQIVMLETSIAKDDYEVKIGDTIQYCGEICKVIRFEQSENYGIRIITNSTGFGRDLSLSELKRDWILEGVDYDEVQALADDMMAGKLDMEKLKVPEVSETGLMKVDIDLYKTMQRKQREAERRVTAIKEIVTKRTEVMRRELNGVLSVMGKMIKRLNSIIFTIELYAGISETIRQIQSGNPASDEEPICLNQLLKYMDEEVGDPDNGGISYDSIDLFDTWLLSHNKHLDCKHYEMLIPQKKGVRIMRVRRNASEHWARDPWENYWHILKEMQTYIIIRNGDNIYTIESKMDFSTKLFPNEEELTKIFEENDEDARYDKLEKYKNGMILMQGLIDRTEVFGELYGKVSFLTTQSQDEGKVTFQYEMDENLLTDGSKTFLDFLDTTTVKAGDRILIVGAENYKTRFFRWYNEHNMPDRPQDGIYKLEYHKERDTLYFGYMQDSGISSWGKWGEKRKNKTFYKISANDGNIVNIDSVSHRDIAWLENMMYDRRDRKKYLRAHGLLKAVQKFKKEELELERPFMLMMVSHLGTTELEALDLIHWWKTKNKHKRPLTLDDQKAFRMIIKKHNADKKV